MADKKTTAVKSDSKVGATEGRAKALNLLWKRLRSNSAKVQ